jgi:quercetin dioxygenase-like cupin family protein
MTGEPETTVWCEDLDRAIALFTQLGLRLTTIFPADDPAVALLHGAGAAVRAVRLGADPAAVEGPAPALRPSYSVVAASDLGWKVGRAGMHYRDLLPDRQGGRFIASHIRIPDGGPVADYVHHHAIEVQIIYCYRGWVRVVYEDQGPPFVMRAGQCVLQPPGIRHRVLEASPGLEVIEVGMPAVHATHVDHALALPTDAVRPERRFGGQPFVRYQPDDAPPPPARLAGFTAVELGVAAATAGKASVHVVRAAAAGPVVVRHDGELLFHVVLDGAVTLDGAHRLTAGGAFAVPAGRDAAWSDASPELALLQVAVPARPA